MLKRAFGSTGFSVATIGEGTWNMETDDRANAVRAIRRALDIGITHVDTAEMYGRGEVERIVGEAISGRRAEVFLVSKVLPYNASRRGTVAACESSLKRLRTDYLDSYLLHWPGNHPLEETIAAFTELESAGKIRSFGVSNFDARLLKQAVSIAGPGKIACNQVLYHLMERRIEHDVIPLCEREGIAVVGYSPFGSGNFPSPKSAGGKELERIAKVRGALPHQVALAFLLRRPHLFTIPKASDPTHVGHNAGAANLELGEDDVMRLDKAFPLGARRSGVPML